MMWAYDQRDCKETSLNGVTYLAQRKRGEGWDIFRFSDVWDGETVAENLTTREVRNFDPDFDVFVLSKRLRWEGDFGDTESALVFHSVHKGYDGAKSVVGDISRFEYSIERAKVRE